MVKVSWVGRRLGADILAYDGPWRNCIHQLYTQYCFLDECPKKLLCLLLRYGSAFDDYWQYGIRGRKLKVVIRKPLWLSIEESGRFAEKPHPKFGDPRQKRLLE